MNEKVAYTLLILVAFLLTALTLSIRHNENTTNIDNKCIHNHNKDLLWMNDILMSKDTIIRYFEDGSRLEFYPSPYKNLNK